MNDVKDLPRYKNINTIQALTIKFINPTNGNIIVEEEGFEPIQMNKSYFSQHQPHVGGYFTINKHGDKGFLSSDDFEENYAKI